MLARVCASELVQLEARRTGGWVILRSAAIEDFDLKFTFWVVKKVAFAYT